MRIVEKGDSLPTYCSRRITLFPSPFFFFLTVPEKSFCMFEKSLMCADMEASPNTIHFPSLFSSRHLSWEMPDDEVSTFLPAAANLCTVSGGVLVPGSVFTCEGFTLLSNLIHRMALSRYDTLGIAIKYSQSWPFSICFSFQDCSTR